MPRKVDHDERRLQIATVVENLVLAHGIEALTIRDVAAQVGFSTTVVCHYFRNKLEMLVFTHRAARQRGEQSLMESLRTGRDVMSAAEELLPITEARWRDWHSIFAFWGLAPAEPAVRSEWALGVAGAKQLFAQLIVAGQQSGMVRADLDAQALATQFLVCINGIASLVTQDRDAWPAARQKALLGDMLRGNLIPNPVPLM